MTYQEMMDIGKAKGLNTVGECYDYVVNNCTLFFNADTFKKEIINLQKDIHVNDIEGFYEAFDSSEDSISRSDLLQEINNYTFDTMDPAMRRAEKVVKVHICELIMKQPTVYERKLM